MPSSERAGAPPLSLLFDRLSTGMKMLFILSMALLPLGVIAVLASIQSAQANHMRRTATIRVIALDSADRLDLSLTRTTLALRAAATALGENAASAATCRHTLDALGAAPDNAIRIAIFDREGSLLCATHGFRPAQPAPVNGRPDRITMLEDGRALRLVVGGSQQTAIGLAEFPNVTLAEIAHPRVAEGEYGLALIQGGATMALARVGPTALGEGIRTIVPVASGQLLLTVTLMAAPLSASETLVIVLPMLMWIVAAATGWLVMDRFVLRPLTILQAAIDGYRGGATVRLPTLTTPAKEMRRLSEAFRGMADTVAGHEAELEEGLERQTKLTREVHHRVKNNLQVVASLLSLHARSATSPEIAAAYASIQRRVDALAIVHRNHYAELEENHGVALRPLIAELASNLRGSMPSDARAPVLTLDLKPFHATQDVAVSIAFLITELVELAMICTPGAQIAIRLDPTDRGDRATLAIESHALHDDACADRMLVERVGRVTGGLARQLRARLARNPDGGSAIEIMVHPTGNGTGEAMVASTPIAAGA